MAEKISMLIVKVDLDCHKCYDKMRKILCKLQDQERIRTISYDDKSKTIAIAGPFDPQRLACKIRCRGGKTVRGIEIIDVGSMGGGGNGKPAPPPGNSKGKKKQKGKPPPQAEQPPPPQPSSPPPEPAPGPPPEMRPSSPPPPQPQPGTPDRGMVTTMPPFQDEDRPMPPPAQIEPPPPPSPKGCPHPPTMEYCMPPPPHQGAPPPPPMMNPRPPPPCPATKPEPYPSECVIPTVEIPSWPAAPICPCGCPCSVPCYQGYYEGCKCGCGGARAYGCAGPPPPALCGYGPYGYRGCRIINEEDPNAACSIM